MGVLGSGLTGLGNVNTAGEPPGGSGGGGGGVTKIIAGAGISLNPTSGLGNVTVSAIDALRQGPDLPDANVTWNPGSDQTSLRVLQAGTLTTDRTLILGVAGSPPIGTKAKAIVNDLGAHAYTWLNGGPGGGIIEAFGPSMLTPRAAIAAFDGTNWNNVDPTYQAGGTFTTPTNPLFASPVLWLRTDLQLTNVAGKGSSWIDQISGRDYAQANPALRPTITAGAIGGKPGLTFGANLFLEAAGGPWASGQQRWLFAVLKPAVAGGGLLLSTRSAGRSWVVDVFDYLAAGTDLALYSDVVGNASEANPFFALDGSPHLAEWYSTVGSPIGFVYDAVTKAVQSFLGNVNTVSSDTGGTLLTTIGNYFGHDAGFVGAVGELIGGVGTLTALQQRMLRAYIADFWTLNLP